MSDENKGRADSLISTIMGTDKIVVTGASSDNDFIQGFRIDTNSKMSVALVAPDEKNYRIDGKTVYVDDATVGDDTTNILVKLVAQLVIQVDVMERRYQNDILDRLQGKRFTTEELLEKAGITRKDYDDFIESTASETIHENKEA